MTYLKELAALDNFNSIKVQLELSDFIIRSTAALFQFHKGTIRTRLTIKRCRRCIISIP